MYSILLVDDEAVAIDGLLEGVHWNRLNIDSVYTANSAMNAKKYFSQHRIDLMLCDIDMPQENGLSLVHWVKEKYPETIVIFFTCYAEFTYAKQAVALGAFDYLLKPARFQEIEEVILRGIHELGEKKKTDRVTHYGEMWIENELLLEEQVFWRDVLNGEMRDAKMKNRAKRWKIDGSEQIRWYQFFSEIGNATTELQRWSQKEIDVAYQNIFEELFLQPEMQFQMVSFNKNCRVVILMLKQGEQYSHKEIQAKGRCLIQALKEHFGFSIHFYVGTSSDMDSLADQYQEFLGFSKNQIVPQNAPFFLEDLKKMDDVVIEIMPEKWKGLLSEARFDEMYLELENLLARAKHDGLVTMKSLRLLYHTFMQMIYVEFQHRNLSVERVFENLLMKEEESVVFASLENFLDYFKTLFLQAQNSINFSSMPDRIVSRINRYIEEHISEELTRDQIAKMVCLSPAYLSRLYSQEAGKSLSGYILEVRIRMMKNFLEQTNLSITEIAYRIGYTNLPYLCSLFRKRTGMTPMEYRKAKQTN